MGFVTLHRAVMAALLALGLLTLVYPTPDSVIKTLDFAAPIPVPPASAFILEPKPAFKAVQDRIEQMNSLRYHAQAAHVALLAMTASYDPSAFAILGTSGKRTYLNYSVWADEPWPATAILRGLRFTEADIRATSQQIDTVCKSATAIGAECLVMAIPNKYRIYPEDIPGYLQPAAAGPAEVLRQVRADVFDPTVSISAHKDDRCPLYYNLDHHWTPVAAYAAFIGLINERRSEPIAWEYQTTGKMIPGVRASARHLDAAGYLLDGRFCETTISVESPKIGGRTLIVGQSFTRFAQRFGVFDSLFESHKIAHFRQWKSKALNDYRPDLVIVALSEHWIPVIHRPLSRR